MRGHLPLIALRRRGMRPSSVWLSLDLPDPSAADWHLWSKTAAIDIDKADGIGSLDLRFVVGMQVHIQGLNADRCLALHQACMDANASRVVTHVARSTHDAHGTYQTALLLVDDMTVFEAPQ